MVGSRRSAADRALARLIASPQILSSALRSDAGRRTRDRLATQHARADFVLFTCGVSDA